MSENDTKQKESKALVYKQQFATTKAMNDKLLQAERKTSLKVPDILRQITAEWLQKNGY